MNREPEARIYDAECGQLDNIFREAIQKSSGTVPCEMWGKIGAILEQARNLAKS